MIGMEEAPENGKESPHSFHANGLFVLMKSMGSVDFTIILVSSVNKTGLAKGFIVCGRSFTYIIKSSGPRTEPCGTPCLIGSHS